MRAKPLLYPLVILLVCSAAVAADLETKPNDPYFAKYQPVKAPAPGSLLLKKNDHLAICGDSITEQKRYSRIMETYITVCVPELNVTVRQFGWGGEKADGFLARMTNDCLRFKPTIATTCYGMNDHLYRAYADTIGARYRSNTTAIVDSFKAHGARVVLGSAGCVGKTPAWAPTPRAATEELNVNLCNLRNIDIEIAKKERVRFADVYWPMLVAGHEMDVKHGTNFAVSGGDGVHPGWAGHVVMAYSFLRALGLNGEIGTFTVDLGSGKAKASDGHEVTAFKDGVVQITSKRYPFCIGEGDPERDDNIRAGTKLVPFNQDLNRLMLVVKRGKAKSYKVTWAEQSLTFTADQLNKGINLAAEFPVNPFSEAFTAVDKAVAAKQAFETRQVKTTFRSAAAKSDMEGTVAQSEKEREPLAAAIKTAFVPVTHTIRIEAE